MREAEENDARNKEGDPARGKGSVRSGRLTRDGAQVRRNVWSSRLGIAVAGATDRGWPYWSTSLCPLRTCARTIQIVVIAEVERRGQPTMEC